MAELSHKWKGFTPGGGESLQLCLSGVCGHTGGKLTHAQTIKLALSQTIYNKTRTKID